MRVDEAMLGRYCDDDVADSQKLAIVLLVNLPSLQDGYS